MNTGACFGGTNHAFGPEQQYAETFFRLFNFLNINKNICMDVPRDITYFHTTYFHLVFILKKSKELDFMVFSQVAKHKVN